MSSVGINIFDNISRIWSPEKTLLTLLTFPVDRVIINLGNYLWGTWYTQPSMTVLIYDDLIKKVI